MFNVSTRNSVCVQGNRTGAVSVDGVVPLAAGASDVLTVTSPQVEAALGFTTGLK